MKSKDVLLELSRPRNEDCVLDKLFSWALKFQDDCKSWGKGNTQPSDEVLNSCVRADISTLSSHRNHLGNLKNKYRCLSPHPKIDLTGLEWNLSVSKFQKLSGLIYCAANIENYSIGMTTMSEGNSCKDRWSHSRA